MTELRSIDYPDIPEAAIRELEALFEHDREHQEKDFLLLIADNEASFPAQILDKIHALAEASFSSGADCEVLNPRADVICEVFMNGSLHEQFRVEIFLRLGSNIAFHLSGIQDTHYRIVAISGLNAYPGEQYDDLVKHLKAWGLQDILRKNIKMLMSGSAPIDYARIQDVFDKVITGMPELASQRDCSALSAKLGEDQVGGDIRARARVRKSGPL